MVMLKRISILLILLAGILKAQTPNNFYYDWKRGAVFSDTVAINKHIKFNDTSNLEMKQIKGGLHVLQDTALLPAYLRDSAAVFQKKDGNYYRWDGGKFVNINPTEFDSINVKNAINLGDNTNSLFQTIKGSAGNLYLGQSSNSRFNTPGNSALGIFTSSAPMYIGTFTRDTFHLGMNNKSFMRFYQSGIRDKIRIGNSSDRLNTAAYTDGLQLAGHKSDGIYPQLSIIGGHHYPRLRMATLSTSDSIVKANDVVSQIYSTTIDTLNNTIRNVFEISTIALTDHKNNNYEVKTTFNLFDTINQFNTTITKSVLELRKNLIRNMVNVRFNGNFIDANALTLTNGQTLISDGTQMIGKDVETYVRDSVVDFIKVTTASSSPGTAVASGGDITLNYTVTGVSELDNIQATPTEAYGSSAVFLPYVAYYSSVNQVSVRLYNPFSTAVTPANIQFYILVTKAK